MKRGKSIQRLAATEVNSLHHPSPRNSLLAQEEIDDRAAAGVRPRPAALGEHVGVVAASVLQRVRQDRHAVEGSLLVDRSCDPRYRAIVPGPPAWIDGTARNGSIPTISRRRSACLICSPLRFPSPPLAFKSKLVE